MTNRFSDEFDNRIRDALSAGRKLDAMRMYCEATGATLSDAKVFVEQIESGSPIMNELTKTDRRAKSLADFGWDSEPADNGGVRLRRNAQWRGTMIGCSLVILLLMSSVVLAVYFFGKGFWKAPDDGVLGVIFLLIPLVFVGGIGLAVTATVVQILRLALWREEWEASPNLLEVRQRLLGFAWSRHHSDGELALEPDYDRDRQEPHWQLAVRSGGEKHWLLREPAISVSVGGAGLGEPSREEAALVAEQLSRHTGWKVLETPAVAGPAVAGDEDELLSKLRQHRFAVDVDERLRLTIRRPKLGQWIGGLVLLCIGSGWLWFMAGAVSSFVSDAQAQQQPLMQIPFWLVMTPMLMAGVGLCALGVASLVGRERWIVDRDVLLIRSRLFGWKFEHEYVDGQWTLSRVRLASAEQTSWTWHLQLQNPSGRTLKVFCMARDDDLPRLLGTVLSQRTGWPLRETETE